MIIRRRLAVGGVALGIALLSSACSPPTDTIGDPAEPPTSAATSPVAAEPTGPVDADPGPRRASLVMGGDLLWHNTVWFSAAEDHERTGRGTRYDLDPTFARLAPLIQRADLAICHEEVPFAARGQHPRSYPVFAAPREFAPWIASMGWDACTTASNHSWDQGYDGVVNTADLLEANGVPHIGTFRTAAERRQPVVLTTDDGVRIGVVAATYSLNGFATPVDQWWAVSQLPETRDDLLDQAARARAAGADIVVAHVHWGTEYDHLPNADQVALADALTASPDVDVVLGEHAHVVQPITRVNGKWVVYGLGNMVAQNEVERPDAYEGITVDLDFAERPDGRWVVSRAAYVPTQWNHYAPGHPIRIVDATGAHLASVRSAVDGVGGNRGLVEERLPR
ncbi:CapA family protein [Nocardioides hankookensis]|uniref:CapA family protein n=1 Tax=Nocardioides hankookensis TaxID=443157 RepID=A0ABW1LRF8_9ACTN